MPDESHGDVSVNGFWKWGTSDLSDMRIVNLDAGSYLFQTSAKALETAEKEKKDKYLHPCIECRSSFTQMVYSANGITGTEAVEAHRSLASLISNKQKREYLEMCGFVRARISLAIVRSNTLFLHGTRDKEVYTRHITNLDNIAVMALLAPWRG